MPPADRWALLRPNLHSTRWREPLMLAAGRLGVSESRAWVQDRFAPRGAVVQAFARLLPLDARIRADMLRLLCSVDWRLRLSAAEVFAAAGVDTVREVVPHLLESLNDHRGLDSWPAALLPPRSS